MPEWLDFLLGGWLSPQPGDSPREALIRFVMDMLINPDQPDIVLQSYYDKLSIFVTIAVAVFVIESLYRAYKAATGHAVGEELKAWLFSAVFLFGLVGLLPGFLASTQIVFNQLGGFFAMTFTGTDNPDEFIETISKLSGNGGLDFFLSIVQIGVIVVFAISLVLIPLSLYASAFLLVIGVSMRWWGHFGETVLKLSLAVGAYALIGNCLALTVIGIGMGFARDTYGDDNQMALALANTGVFVIAGIVTIVVLFMFKQKINAAVQGATKGLSGGISAVRGGFHRQKGAGSRQVGDSVAGRARRAQNSNGNEGSSTRSGKLKNRQVESDPATTTTSKDKVASSGKSANVTPTLQGRRVSSSASRSRTRVSDAGKTAMRKSASTTSSAQQPQGKQSTASKAQIVKTGAKLAASTTPQGRAVVVAQHVVAKKVQASPKKITPPRPPVQPPRQPPKNK